MVSRSSVVSRLADRSIVWIDPLKVDHYVGLGVVLTRRTDEVLRRAPIHLRGLPLLRKALGALRPRDPPFIIATSRYRTPAPIGGLDKYLLIKDLVDRDGAYLDSRWYADLRAKVERGGRAHHKGVEMRSAADIHAFFDSYVLPLVASMRRDGYDMQLGARLGQALIGPDGQLHKAKHGDHRFFVARLVGAERFPLQIVGVHEAWVQVAGLDARLQDSDQLAQAVREVERRHR